MQTLRANIERLASSTSVVLLRGATGTGKEAAARALHEAGPRRDRPFVAVNLNALSDSLFESELFGHVPGAFTGAQRGRVGHLERAEGGTLFLDEIGDLAPVQQVKLLRVLEQRAFLPVGAHEERPLRARLVAATHVDLEHDICCGRFREDLYYPPVSG